MLTHQSFSIVEITSVLDSPACLLPLQTWVFVANVLHPFLITECKIMECSCTKQREIVKRRRYVTLAPCLGTLAEGLCFQINQFVCKNLLIRSLYYKVFH